VVPTIVVAIEENTADRVARAGGELARALSGRMVLAHVRDDPRLFNSKMERERARNRTTRRGHEALARAQAALPTGLGTDVRVELGIAADRLAEIAEEVGATLIVTGTRGRGRLASAVLGSVSQTLARQAPCPVMVIPGQAAAIDPDINASGRSTIVAGLDGTAEPSDAVRFARAIAARLGDRLSIVHTHAAGTPPAHTLQAISACEGARLIVVNGDEDDRILADSLAARLSRLAPCPLIIVPKGTGHTLDQAGGHEGRLAA
jgi:nucleotide-binding universal stress UspA family protein